MTSRARRNMFAGRYVFVGLMMVALQVSALGQTATATATLFRPRTFLGGARALGFADAYIADIQDVNSMYWNPAALVYMQHTSIVLNHTLDRSSNSMNENIATPLFVRKGEVVAIGLTLNHVGHVGKSAFSDFKALQYAYDVAYSKELVPTFCVGGAVNVRYGTASSGNLWALSSSVGVFYSPAEGITYGAVFGGLGNGIRYTYDGAATVLSQERLPKDLQVGATLHFPAPEHKTYVTLAIGNEKVFGQSGLRYKGGAEYVFLHLVALRFGYIVDPDVKVATYGLGLRAGKMQIDYGMLPSRAVDRLYQFTLSYDFWNKNESIRTDR